MKQIFMLCNNCLEKAFADNGWLVDSQRCTCIFLEPIPVGEWVVKYSALFVKGDNLSGQFTVTAANREEAISKAKLAMMAKAREQRADLLIELDERITKIEEHLGLA